MGLALPGRVCERTATATNQEPSVTADYSHAQPPALSYRFEFRPDELDDIVACTEAHGFSIVRGLLPESLVEILRAEVKRVVDPDDALGPGESRTHLSFIEEAENAWEPWLGYEPFMDLHRALLGGDDLCFHRSAAIIRNPGSKPVGWHTDWHGQTDGPPQNSGDVLNRGLWPSGKWFYITGSRPSHGGLCVIEDSHIADWQGPEGFHLTADRRSFYPADGEGERRYDGFDIPGLVPLFTDPGDCIVFAHRTFHGAFPNREEHQRMSCAVGFRRKSHVIDAPWDLPESSRRFIDALPERFRGYTEGYTGIDPTFKGAAAA